MGKCSNVILVFRGVIVDPSMFEEQWTGKTWKKKNKDVRSFWNENGQKNHWHLLRNDMSFLWVMQGKDLFMAFFHGHVPLVPRNPTFPVPVGQKMQSWTFQRFKDIIFAARLGLENLFRTLEDPSKTTDAFVESSLVWSSMVFRRWIQVWWKNCTCASTFTFTFYFLGSSSCIQYHTYIYIQTCYIVLGYEEVETTMQTLGMTWNFIHRGP